MALRAVDQPELSGRLAYLLQRSGVKKNALSLQIGRPAGFISWLMKHAKSVPSELLVPISEALAGRGGVTNDPVEVGKYLIGFRDDPPIDSTGDISGFPGSLIPVAA